MRLSHVVAAAAAATLFFLLSMESAGGLPSPWRLDGQSPQKYIAGIDLRESISGTGSKFLRCRSCNEESWARLTEKISAKDYRGQRIRFQAQMKAQDIEDWAGLWMRIDTPEQDAVAFYNSEDKPLKGTTNWQLRTVTLDVPQNASVIAFGVVVWGKGAVWIDDLKFSTVGNDTPVDKFKGTSKGQNLRQQQTDLPTSPIL